MSDANVFLSASWHLLVFNSLLQAGKLIHLTFAAALSSSFGGIAMSEPGELQEAKAELQKKNIILRKANERHDELLVSSSAKPEEISKAELDVAKAELSVAKAELSVAKAKEDTPERQFEIAKAEWDVAKAVYDVAEVKGSSQDRLGALQAETVAKQAIYMRLEGQLSSLTFVHHISHECLHGFRLIVLARLCVQIVLLEHDIFKA
jgi:hypothetical protein